MLQYNNITITHRFDQRPLVKDFSLSLQKQDKIAIISEEGNGKSTLLKLAVGEPLDYVDVKGYVFVDNVTLGYLPQRMTDEHLNLSPMDYLKSDGLNIFDYMSEYYRTLEALNLDEAIFQRDKCQNLSGGERIKLQFLKILLIHPDVYLLDEPSNDIDLETILWLENFILGCEQPILFVSHDEMLLRKCANGIVHLENTHRKTQAKHTIVKTNYESYVHERLHRIDKWTQVASKQRKEAKEKQERLQQQFSKVQHELRTITRQDPATARLLKKKMKSIKSKEKRYEKEKEDFIEKPDVEEAINLHFQVEPLPRSKRVVEMNSYQLKIGDHILSENISLVIKGQDHVGIIGHNGSGKTTLIKRLLEMISSNLKVGVMPQNYDEYFKEGMTPIEFLKNNYTKEEHDKIHTTLGSLKYTFEEMNRSVQNLSGGQKAKLYLTKLVLDECQILVLDEPTRNLSPLSMPELRHMLSSYAGCLITVSHDRLFLKETCQVIYQLNKKGLEEINRSFLES